MKPLSLALLLFASMASDATSLNYSTTNWTIDSASVCNNLKRGSVDYRDCRSNALEFFKQRCEQLKQSVENQGMNAPDDLRHEKDMFCHAASTFSPVN